MAKFKFIPILFFSFCYLYNKAVEGYGYRYNFNPGTGDTNLWTFLPGHLEPMVHAYNDFMRVGVQWPQVYTVPYDGLLPGEPVIPGTSYHDDPNIYRYKGADGKYRYKCKPDAYWSEFQSKCIWKPIHFTKKRLQG